MKRKQSSPHYGRKRRRRNPSRRRTKRSRRNTISTLVPKTKWVTLKYCGEFDLGDAQLDAGHLVSCNSMFDPDHSGIGHQPLGFDQWMTFYNHFEVRSSKVSFFINSAVSATTLGTYATLRLDANTTVDGIDTISEAIEQPSCTVKYIKPANAGGRTVISKSWNAASEFGRHQLGNSVMKGTSGASPTEQTYYRLKLTNSKNLTGLIDTHHVVFIVTYTALLTERKDIAASS